MRGDFLITWETQRVYVYRGIMNKSDKKGCITNSTQKNKNKNRKWANLHRTNDLLKTIRSTRHSNYRGFKKPPGPEKLMFFCCWQFVASWSIWGPILAPTGFWRGPPNQPSSDKINIKLEKRMYRKVSWKNITLGWIYDVRMGGLDKPKQAFRVTRVAKDEFSGSCEI